MGDPFAAKKKPLPLASWLTGLAVMAAFLVTIYVLGRL
jgi:hypothetical protein